MEIRSAGSGTNKANEWTNIWKCNAMKEWLLFSLLVTIRIACAGFVSPIQKNKNVPRKSESNPLVIILRWQGWFVPVITGFKRNWCEAFEHFHRVKYYHSQPSNLPFDFNSMLQLWLTNTKINTKCWKQDHCSQSKLNRLQKCQITSCACRLVLYSKFKAKNRFKLSDGF